MQLQNEAGNRLTVEQSLLVEVDHDDAAVLRVSVTGELDRVSAEELRETVAEAMARRLPGCVEIDLHGVSFLDSAGIKALVVLYGCAEERNCRIRLTRPQPWVLRVLDITGLLEPFGVTGP